MREMKDRPPAQPGISLKYSYRTTVGSTRPVTADRDESHGQRKQGRRERERETQPSEGRDVT
jgi:hypothetical protein